jgi:hypothetical protein
MLIIFQYQNIPESVWFSYKLITSLTKAYCWIRRDKQLQKRW